MAKNFAQQRQEAAQRVRSTDRPESKDNLSSMTSQKVNFTASKGSSSSPTNTGWTAINNPNNSYSIDNTEDPQTMQMKILSKKKHG